MYSGSPQQYYNCVKNHWLRSMVSEILGGGGGVPNSKINLDRIGLRSLLKESDIKFYMQGLPKKMSDFKYE